MTSRDDHLLRITAHEHERDARRRYEAAIAAAIESLRRAEQRFDKSSAAIETHIQVALAAAASLTASLVSAFRVERRTADVVAAVPAPADEMWA